METTTFIIVEVALVIGSKFYNLVPTNDYGEAERKCFIKYKAKYCVALRASQKQKLLKKS